MQYTQRYSRRRFLGYTAAAAALPLVATIATPCASSPKAEATGSLARLADDASAEFRAVADAAESAMKAAGVPGAALGIYGNGREELAVFGLADVAGNRPVTLETRFQVGSITKPHTATAALRLVEQHKLDLDARVRTYIPALRLQDESVAANVTIRHLLTHTGGWFGDMMIENGTDDAAMARYVDEVFPTLPQLTPLGSYVNYNNSALGLLGRVIEVVTGQTYREAMERLVFAPLGMRSATFDPAVALTNPHALGYGEVDGRVDEITPLLLPRHVDPAGNLWLNIADVVRFGRFQAGNGLSADGKRVLKEETLRQMQTPQKTLADPHVGAIGFTWAVIDLPGGLRMLDHAGDPIAQASRITILPTKSLVIAVVTNSQDGAAVRSAAVAAALEEYAGTALQKPSFPAEPLNMSRDELEQYAGSYDLPTDSFLLTLTGDGLQFSHILKDPPGQVQPSNRSALPTSSVTFIGRDEAVIGTSSNPIQKITFERRKDGTVGWMVVGATRLIPRR
jgi:CubicO group peptidase (beta-lactamase class C family)